MNNDLFELWGRWALAAAKGQQQVNVMGDWLQNNLQILENFSTGFLQLWGAGKPSRAANQRSAQQPQREEYWQNAWGDAFLQMQESFWCFQTPGQVQELQKKVMELEQQLAVQGRTLELLKSRLDYNMPEQTDHFAGQFRELIERQNQQFQQLTSSFAEYFKEARKDSGTRNE